MLNLHINVFLLSSEKRLSSTRTEMICTTKLLTQERIAYVAILFVVVNLGSGVSVLYRSNYAGEYDLIERIEKRYVF